MVHTGTRECRPHPARPWHSPLVGAVGHPSTESTRSGVVSCRSAPPGLVSSDVIGSLSGARPGPHLLTPSHLPGRPRDDGGRPARPLDLTPPPAMGTGSGTEPVQGRLRPGSIQAVAPGTPQARRTRPGRVRARPLSTTSHSGPLSRGSMGPRLHGPDTPLDFFLTRGRGPRRGPVTRPKAPEAMRGRAAPSRRLPGTQWVKGREPSPYSNRCYFPMR